ncbi:hypothetical protein AB0F09_03100 [Streptomyces olivaceus]|uniref:hypothetical protein n=1 Tax=Streptomyces TaxID=1883 RepID=UPI0033E5E837
MQERQRITADRSELDALAGVLTRLAARAVLLIPHRGDAADEGGLPGDYRKILAIGSRHVRRRAGRARN